MAVLVLVVAGGLPILAQADLGVSRFQVVHRSLEVFVLVVLGIKI